MSYKPEGYPDLSPYLVVRDAEYTLRFCTEVLEGETKRIHRRENGNIEHGEVKIGDSLVMFGQKGEGIESLLHLYVAHPEKVFQAALAFGAREIQPVEEQGDGDRRGAVKDANGISWYFASAQS